MIEITLDAPGKNALSTDLMTRTVEAFRNAGDAPVLLSGAGGCFSAGLNLREVVSLGPDQMRTFLQLLTDLCRTIWMHPGPTVALVEGHAIAGGCVLAQCCDVRIGDTSAKARMGLNEVALGLRFPPTVFALMRDRIPRMHHEEVFLGAGLHLRADSLRLGMLDRVSENARADSEAALKALAQHPRASYAATKHDLRANVRASAEQEAAFAEHAIPSWTSDEFKARITAVLGG